MQTVEKAVGRWGKGEKTVASRPGSPTGIRLSRLPASQRVISVASRQVTVTITASSLLIDPGVFALGENEDDDLWKGISDLLDGVLQQGAHSLTCSEIAAMVRRGPLGITGVCRFFTEAALLVPSQSDALVPRVQRLLNAVRSL